MALFQKAAEPKPAPQTSSDNGGKDYPPDVPMPVGTHRAKVVFAMHKPSKTGKLGWTVKFQDGEGRVAWWAQYVSPESEKAMEIFYKNMEILSLGPNFLNDESTTPDEVAEAMLGSEALVSVVVEAWEGREFRKIKRIAEAV